MSTVWGASYVPTWPAEHVEHVERAGRHRHRRLHRERAITGWLESVAEHLASEARDQGVPMLPELPPRRRRRRPAGRPAIAGLLLGAATGMPADAAVAAAPAALV